MYLMPMDIYAVQEMSAVSFDKIQKKSNCDLSK